MQKPSWRYGYFWLALLLGLFIISLITWRLYWLPQQQRLEQHSEFEVTAQETGLGAELEVPVVTKEDPTTQENTPLVTIPIEITPSRKKTEGKMTSEQWNPPTDPSIPEESPGQGEDNGTSELPIQQPEPPVLRPTPDPGREPEDSHPTPDRRTPRRQRR